MNTIALKLRKLRKLHGYRQEYVAHLMGISQAAYSKKETGKTELSLTVLEQIAHLYQISTSDLIGMSTSELLVVAVRRTAGGAS